MAKLLQCFNNSNNNENRPFSLRFSSQSGVFLALMCVWLYCQMNAPFVDAALAARRLVRSASLITVPTRKFHASAPLRPSYSGDLASKPGTRSSSTCSISSSSSGVPEAGPSVAAGVARLSRSRSLLKTLFGFFDFTLKQGYKLQP